MRPSVHGPRLYVTNISELCLPQANGAGVERLTGHGIYIDGGKVAWVGPETDRPSSSRGAPRLDVHQRAVLPTLVDAHTHLVWGGERVEDFSRRSRGLTYAQIAEEGGGILTTVEGTRSAPFDRLLSSARERLEARARYGIFTTEIKSGYGLSIASELKMLEVVSALRAEGWDVEGTLLAAHAIPKDTERTEWVRQIVEDLIPEVAARGLARFVDAFVERGAYSVAEARAVFEAGARHGLIPKIHADQITSGGGAELAAEVHAASADHLENISDEALGLLASRGVTAVLLPGAMVYLGDSAPRLGRRLIDAGIEVAVATDTNPGSSPTQNLPLMGTLAVSLMGLTAEEALRAMTLGGAHALRRDDVGTLRPGARGQFVVLGHQDSRALVSSFGEPVVADLVVCRGGGAGA